MNYRKIGQVLIYVGLGFLFVFTIVFAFNTTDLNTGPIDSSVWGQYGDIIGGFVGTIVALVGVLLLYETLKQQRDSFTKQQVETRFFELVRLHRENVIELKSKGKSGREIFIQFKDEFHDLFEKVKERYPQDQSARRDNPKDINVWYKELTQISYLILFYGVDNSSEQALKRKIEKISNNWGVYKDIEEHIIDKISKKHKEDKENNRTVGTVKRYLKYDGQQSRLGHYFRHLFQTVKYVNNQPSRLFSYEEKYNYIKTLRAQLSTHEQAVLFYNSLTELGHPWELNQTDDNHKLITKYNLIKNLPDEFTGVINPKFYYRDVFFEFDKLPTQNRRELEKGYR